MSKTKTKKKTTKKQSSKQPDLNYWFSKLSDQLERLIICHEKQLAGQVIPDFDSKAELKEKQGDS